MVTSLTAVFDGQVLRPDGPVDLRANTRYRVTVEETEEGTAERNVWDVLEQLAGVVEAPADWAAEHDHYLYGTPRRGEARSS
jgi:hypothetical protein